jgi:hypothetical protein
MRRCVSLFLLLVLAACGSSSPAAKRSSPSPTTASTTASAAPQPSPTASCPYFDAGGGLCLGPLAAGTYTTQYFQPPVTYTVPRGWNNAEDQHTEFVLIPPGGNPFHVDEGTSDFVGIYPSVAAPDGCNERPAPGVATTAAAVADWLVHNPALLVTKRHAVKVGGLSGVVVDLAVSPRAKACPYSNGQPVAPYLIGAQDSDLQHNTGNAGQKTRLFLLDHDGELLAIELVHVKGGGDLDAYSAITKTLVFGD